MFERMQSGGAELTFTFEGERVFARAGDTVAAALLAAGRLGLRRTPAGAARGPFCMMGACYDCLVEVDGQRVQACMTPVIDGLQVARTRQEGERI